jgi:hypothetical protein
MPWAFNFTQYFLGIDYTPDVNLLKFLNGGYSDPQLIPVRFGFGRSSALGAFRLFVAAGGFFFSDAELLLSLGLESGGLGPLSKVNVLKIRIF